MSRRFLAFLACVAVAWVFAACGGKRTPGPIESRAPRARTLALIPADTPYVFVALDTHQQTPWTPTTRDFYDAMAKGDKGGNEPGPRMLRRLLLEMRDGTRIRSARELGFTEHGKFVLYGLSLWPVMRLEIEDAAKVRALVGRVLAEGGSRVQRRTTRGVTYWLGTVEKISIVAAVLEHELVLAVLPAATAERALPLVLGTERPARTLVAEQMIEKEAARHGYLRDWIGYIDSKRVLDLLAGGGVGTELELGALWQDQSLAGCKDDFERIAKAFPRVVFGYRRMDAKGIEAELLFEAPELGTELAQLRTAIPALAQPQQRPLFAMSIGADAGGLMDWVQSVADGFEARPFTCTGLSELGDAIGSLATSLAGAPAFVRTMKGAAIVVDDITLKPPSGTGTAIVVGDGVPMLVSMIWSVPPLAGTPQPTPGLPVAVPLDQLGITSAHVGVGADRFALAVGPDSGKRVHTTLAASAPRRSPLVWFELDVVRADELGAFEGKDRDIEKLSKVTMSLDATPRGIVFGFTGTWRERR